MNIKKSFAVSIVILMVILIVRPQIYGGFTGAVWSLLELFVFVGIPSMGFAVVYQQWKKNIFTPAEFFALSAGNYLVLIPAIVLISIYTLPYQFVSFPLIVLSFLSCWMLYKSRLHTMQFTAHDYTLLFIIVLFGVFLWILIHSYYPLPDFDPYYWLSRYTTTLSEYKGAFHFPIGDRPGFFAMPLLYTLIAKIDVYALFKYVLPLLYLLPIFPLWMIAKRMKYAWPSYVIMSAVVWSASTILYALTSMPQMICISAFFFFISFLAYARMTREPFYIAVGAGFLGLCIPIYELAIIPFVPIALCIIWKWRKKIISTVRKNPITVLLVILLIATNIHYIASEITFFVYWVSRIISQLFSINWNFRFPAHYINVDGNSVGWPGIVGIMKYYAYYVGPPTLVVLSILIYMVCSKKYRSLFLYEMKNHVESQIAFLTFLIFFSISEVFPRILNLALLPERVWLFGGIVLLYPAILLLQYASKKISNTVAIIIIVTSVSSMFGAWYINHLKQHLIPSYQLSSASWVQSNLPLDRIMISDENSNLLAFFSSSKTATIFPLYCNQEYSNPRLLLNKIQLKNLNHDMIQNVYIFYAKTDPNNPYNVRPYIKPRETCNTFVFDEYPQHYHRVYSDDNRVIIWQIN